MTLIPLIVLVPTVAAVVGLFVGRNRMLSALVAVAGTTITLGLALVAAFRTWGEQGTVDVWATVPTGWVPITMSTRADGLSVTVAVMVAAIAVAIQIYSVAYMRPDPRYGSYASFVSLFTAAMLLVVVADDLIVLLVGWEVMGLCSYVLIGHHWELREARAAAVKAFVVTRLGDIGLLFGIFTLGDAVGSFQVSRLSEAVEAGALTTSTVVTVGTLLVLCGVVGKSAQVPLHVWLPDAMAGPAPVSALIHAATMVAAGVYLVARLYDVFLLAPATLATLAVIAAVTMLGAALAAFAQDDLKRVLAYSTASQLAYMFGALAVGGYSAGLLHLLAHAAFKALLFLCAGAVIHVVGSNLLSRMGGLREDMPVTFWTMTIGFGSLAAVPPLAGFFTKETVLGAAEHAVVDGGPAPGWAALLVLLAAMATTFVTAAYVVRAWLLTFFGEPARSETSAHDPVPMMRWPLIALAVPSAVLGVLVFMPDATRAAFSTAVPGVAALPLDYTDLHLGLLTIIASLLLAGAGGYLVYKQWLASGQDPAIALGSARQVLASGFGVDRLYDDLFVRPLRPLAQLVVAGDDDVVQGYVLGAGRATSGLGALTRQLQRGQVQQYLTAVVAAVVLLAAAGVALS